MYSLKLNVDIINIIISNEIKINGCKFLLCEFKLKIKIIKKEILKIIKICKLINLIISKNSLIKILILEIKDIEFYLFD